MSQTSDIVIIGAGIIGLATARQLQRSGVEKITVLEQAASPGAGSSGASSAVCRHLYTHDEMIGLARDGIDTYRHWPDFLGLESPRAQLNEIGVLWIGDTRASANAERLARHGIATTVLDASDLPKRFPMLNACTRSPDFATGRDHDCRADGQCLFEETGGHMDPQDALDDLVESIARHGATVRFNTTVEAIEHDDARVTGVRLADGEQLKSPIVVNANGPWCNRLLAPFEFLSRWPLEPTRIQVVHLPVGRQLTEGLPVCGDFTSGVFRPQGEGQIIAGSTLEADEQEAIADPDEFDRLADADFMALKMHALKHRLPTLSDRTRVGSYCGLYTVNRADMHPLVGATPLNGLFAANGFSGHGFKLAPAIGSLLARAITAGRSGFDTAVDLGFLGWQRQPLHLDSMNVLA